MLTPYDFGAIYCSDLSRAHRTADLIAAVIGCGPPIPDRRLRERDIGAWSGLTDRQIAERWQGQPEKWRADEDAAPPGGGEDAAAVADRARECLAEIHDRHNGCRTLLVTHGGLIRTLDRACGGSHNAVPNLGGLWFEALAGEFRAAGDFDARDDADAEAVY